MWLVGESSSVLASHHIIIRAIIQRSAFSRHGPTLLNVFARKQHIAEESRDISLESSLAMRASPQG